MPNHSAPSRVLAVFLAVAIPAAPALAGTLDDVKQRGHLNCGVNQGLLGFGIADASGKWAGFDVDYCRAVAAAVLGDPGKVEYMPVSAAERFDVLKAGKIDLLARNSTWTMSRETQNGLTFVGTNYYDGQGFLVNRSANLDTALGLTGLKICVQSGTTTEACAEGGQDVGYIANGDWLQFNNVNFGTGGVRDFVGRVASGAGGGISGLVEVRIDSRSNAPIGSFALASTGGWQTWQSVPANVSNVTGTHTVFLTFTSGQPADFVNVNWIQFRR